MMYVSRKSMVSCFIAPLCIALLLCGIFGIVWLRSSFISMEYGISELEKGRLEKLRETKLLMAEKAALLSMQKVEKTAVANLGLVFPKRTKVVSVKEKSSGSFKASYEGTQYGANSIRSNETAGSSGGTL